MREEICRSDGRDCGDHRRLGHCREREAVSSGSVRRRWIRVCPRLASEMKWIDRLWRVSTMRLILACRGPATEVDYMVFCGGESQKYHVVKY